MVRKGKRNELEEREERGAERERGKKDEEEDGKMEKLTLSTMTEP